MSGERPGGWVEGIGWVALASDLVSGDYFTEYVGGIRHVGGYAQAGRQPIILTRWADGTTPAPPNPDTDGGLHHSCLNPIVCAVCLRAAATPAPVTPPTECVGHVDVNLPHDWCDRCGSFLRATPPETVPVPRADVEAAASIIQEARYCEGLQEWWGTDSDRMARLDAALDAMRRCGGVR